MLSSSVNIAIPNTLVPAKPSPTSFWSDEAFRRPFSLRRLRVRAAAGVAFKEEEERGLSSGDAGDSPEYDVPPTLRRELMPKHVAVIMDGNVRWARKRGLPSGAGHEAGVKSLRQLVEICCRWGIKVLTVFAFSYDNWVRPQVEVEFLMSLFERVIKSEIESFKREGIRISVIGDSTKLPPSLQQLIHDAEESTKENLKFQFIVAVSYSGKYDVVQACKSVAQKAKEGVIELGDINESLIEQELETNCTEYPYPDLLIRTSGELRVSNFLLWQLAYTEFFFVQTLWPDFGIEDFTEALTSFQQRQRRYVHDLCCWPLLALKACSHGFCFLDTFWP
ncbi:hypothetical protein QYF36_004286 [Acer negundo]|nr:hypothetical protein QYF36_004286 [Acer negundo]